MSTLNNSIEAKNNLNNILNIGNDVLKSVNNGNGAKIGVYNYANLGAFNEKQKRSVRAKLRKKLAQYIETLTYFDNEKNIEQCKKTINFFNQFAKQTYIDTRILYENNTSQEKINEIMNFQKLVEKYTNTSKEQKK